MSKYTSRDTSPLLFHKFYWYAFIPFSFLVSTYNFMAEISNIRFFHWIIAIVVVAHIIGLASLFITFVGFFNWKSYSWYAVFITLINSLLYNALIFIIFSSRSYNITSEFRLNMLTGCFWSVVRLLLIGWYYSNRKDLFFIKDKASSEAVITYDSSKQEQC